MLCKDCIRFKRELVFFFLLYFPSQQIRKRLIPMILLNVINIYFHIQEEL